MVKWGPVVVGFILALVLGNLFGIYVNEYWGVNLGLFISGFIVGYWVHEGIIGDCGMQQLLVHLDPLFWQYYS